MNKNYVTNIIKYVCAIMVIFSHSFAIASASTDYLGIYTNDSLTFGALSVYILFAISGFYITKSLDYKGGGFNFVKNRVFKLIPSLSIVVLLCIFVVGPIFTDNLINYFQNPRTYLYLLNIIFIPVHSLPGVFNNNIYPSVVNGALWTMSVQVCCYIYIFL